MCFWVARCGGRCAATALVLLAATPLGGGWHQHHAVLQGCSGWASLPAVRSYPSYQGLLAHQIRASIWFITVYANASSQQHIQRYHSLNKFSLLDDTPVASFPYTHTQGLVHKRHKHYTYPYGHLHTHRKDVFVVSVNERKQSQPLASQETDADCWMIPSAPKPE